MSECEGCGEERDEIAAIVNGGKWCYECAEDLLGQLVTDALEIGADRGAT